jgi:hypothetical protein
MDDLHMKGSPHRRSASLLILARALLLGGLLQSCAGGGQTLTKSTAPAGKTAPPITVVEMKGIPAEKAQMLTEFMAEAAGRRDIAIVQGAFGDGYRLDGSFTAKSNAAGTVLGYQWTLADAAGQSVHSFSGTEVAGVASGDAWSAAVPDALRNIAKATANGLAGRLAELGYTVRSGALGAPSRSLASGAAPAPAPDLAYSGP